MCDIQIYNRLEVGEFLSVDTVTAYLKKKFPKANAARILGVDSSYDDNRKVMQLHSVMCSMRTKTVQFKLLYVCFLLIFPSLMCRELHTKYFHCTLLFYN